VLISIFVISLISTAIYYLQSNIVRTSRLFQANLTTQQQVRTTLKEFERELQSAAPSQAGAYPIVEASTTQVTFFTDYDRDGYKERIRYFYSTSTRSIKKGVIEPSGVGTTTYNSATEAVNTRIDNVAISATTTALFTYFDANYDGVGTNTPMTQPVGIPSVRHIRMMVSVIPKGEVLATTSKIMFFQTDVTPRNLKDNL
jgi:type II secretory pathway pseudopilin PulG